MTKCVATAVTRNNESFRMSGDTTWSIDTSSSLTNQFSTIAPVSVRIRIMDLTETGAMVLNWFVKLEEVSMLQVVSPLILKLSLFLVTAVATHLVISFGQTFLHYKVAHHPIGGKLFRNHINFHHTHYAEDHLVSLTYLGDEGNITPYFFIPIFLVGACAYFLLPLNLFVVTVIASAASFYAHVFFNRQYHVEGSWLQRFAWFG